MPVGEGVMLLGLHDSQLVSLRLRLDWGDILGRDLARWGLCLPSWLMRRGLR